MENRENIVTNDLRWAKNDSNKIIQTGNDGNNLWKNNKPQRTALGNLSENTSFRSSQTRTKPPTLSILYDKNRISTSDKASKTIVAGSPRQAFTIYIDQELDKDSQSLKDIAIHDIDDEKKSSPTVINYIDDTCDVNCDEENIPVPDIVHVPDSDGNFAKTGLPEYEMEIHDYFKEAEQRHRPNRNFMNGQPLINKSMRAILVDWLVEVAEEYRLVPETLYLTVNYIDRFLSSKVVIAPSKLQLVGVACMLIASKIEEIYPPEVSEFVYITNSTYTGDQVKEMEKFVLKLLAFDLAVPTALSFLDHYEKGVELPGGLSQKFSHLTRYYCELALLDSDIQWTYLPSAVAASSVVLALGTNGFTSWFPLLSENTGFELSDLETCIDDMHKVVLKAVDSKLQSIRDKYSEPRFSSVASIMAGKPPFP